MSHVDQVADLLLEWDDARANGRELTPEELCSDCPDLVDEVREGIRELQSTDWLFAADETEADFPSLTDSR